MKLHVTPLRPDQLTDDPRRPLAFSVIHGRGVLVIDFGARDKATGDIETVRMLLRRGAVLLAAPADVLDALGAEP